ncbi:proteasome assembly chaperone 4-like [Athalia rosae]|uniref:proteasome assembly chaperone 4-like n=1 Tax=Athalia rosae TaxID=37344 RepID=UPI0020339492|nr:proteasome assembly chaperone 4-like [Athalia rosae]
MASSEDNGVELLPCSFKFHNFLTEVGEVKMSCQIIKMRDSFYVWVGNYNNNVMNHLSLALVSNYEKVPISTTLLGSVADSTSTNMAKRLAKKLGMPVYVSFNIEADNLSMPAIEKKLQQEINIGFVALADEPRILESA